MSQGNASYADILRRIAQLMGIPWPPQDEDVQMWRGFVGRRFRQAWIVYTWPETLLDPEKRYWYPEWDAGTTYSKGDIRWYGDEDAPTYYKALAPTTGDQPDESPDEWEAVSRFARRIAYEATGETRLGELHRVYVRDPALYDNPGDILWTTEANGVRFSQQAPGVVWVHARKPYPTLDGDDWSATATYSEGDVRFYNSADFYRAAEAIAAGESPATDPAKWELQAVPRVLVEVVAQAAYADALRPDGQLDKALGEGNAADPFLDTEIENLVRKQRQPWRRATVTMPPAALP